MELEITMEDVELLENKLPDFAKWCTENLPSFGASAIAVSALVEKIEELKEEFSKDEWKILIP